MAGASCAGSLTPALYPLLWYAYHYRYKDWIQSEEWTFIYCVLVFGGHVLSFLATRWSNAIRAKLCYRTVSAPGSRRWP